MSPEAMLCDPDEWVWLQAMARDNNYLAPTPMGGGQWAALSRFAFTCAILTGHMFDDFTYENRWCYDSTHKAAIGLADWISNGFEGEPKGWHRHPDSGRRRPDGDQAKEYVNQ
jgi:hypothetical protein